jgi:hypothetical protein
MAAAIRITSADRIKDRMSLEINRAIPMRTLAVALEAFLTVLRSSWHSVRSGLVETAGWDESVLDDWAQANWEMIVEAALSREQRVVLDIYAAGADCNDLSSRVWQPELRPTHAVACRIIRPDGLIRDHLSGRDIAMPSAGLRLSEFVTLTENGGYRPEPPFDYALVDSDGVDAIVSLSEVSFVLVKAETSAGG